ncbi:unnamed protein product [Euphydryas editha]|uniref:Ig-like domain-containing protein n=1 Tax=Euphydryas editha TaxID=104508 RepID=A0AAU9VDK5_EUPED|nr:unnamed protein product [Euphydryas editha]
MKEPPNRVDFSNTTGAVVECAARGSPAPDVIWVRADGTAVGDVPGLRQVLPNGNLVFPPFRAEDYRQEVHAQVYACLARNPVGTIHSRDVNVRAVVSQAYTVNLVEENVLRGNAAIFKCLIPSFVTEYVHVASWIIIEDDEIEILLNDTVNNMEPIGRVPPKFSSTQVGAMFIAKLDLTFTLQCPAQAFPVPVFRAYGQSIAEISNNRNWTQF